MLGFGLRFGPRQAGSRLTLRPKSTPRSQRRNSVDPRQRIGCTGSRPPATPSVPYPDGLRHLVDFFGGVRLRLRPFRVETTIGVSWIIAGTRWAPGGVPENLTACRAARLYPSPWPHQDRRRLHSVAYDEVPFSPRASRLAPVCSALGSPASAYLPSYLKGRWLALAAERTPAPIPLGPGLWFLGVPSVSYPALSAARCPGLSLPPRGLAG